MIKAKETNDRLTLTLDHGSVVLFSQATNARYLHKIVLPGSSSSDVQWLGLTMRTAKTHICFRDGVPHLPSGTQLTLADEPQRQEFYRLRGQENRSTSFSYPAISYTISEGDLLPPIQ